MSNNPQKLVSIVIAAYNIEKYVSQTIESALNQTYKNIEVIIVNDGSTDGTSNIIETYAKKDTRIVIFNQANKGVSAARNAGFKIAKGEYFCIVDADDIMLPIKIESQVDFLENNSSADFAYSKVYYFIDGTHAIYRHDLATISGAHVYEKLLQYGNFIYTSTVFFRRNVFDQFGGFDENLRSAEEFDYWLSLSQRGVNFLHQNKYLTLCRSRNNGLTSDSVTMYLTAVAVLEKHMANSKNKLLSKITNYQYLKSKFLLYVSSNIVLNKAYALLKKIKFLMTFKKVHDKNVQDYLIMIESHTAI